MKLEEKDLPLRAGIILYNNKLEVLLVHPLGNKNNQWDFPKGHFDTEKDITLEDTALRELEEETNIYVSDTFQKGSDFFQNGDDYTEDNYNGTKLRLYFVYRRTIDLSKCKCTSLIDNNCTQEWKRGLPENDKFELIHWSKLRGHIYKSYEKCCLLDDIEDFFDSLEEEIERIQ